jgi:hypothetical protein
MGFMKRWDLNDIRSQIQRCGVEVLSPYNDGFVAWSCKRDLYELKFIIEELLSEAPKFGSEETNLIQEYEQKKLIKILKK